MHAYSICTRIRFFNNVSIRSVDRFLNVRRALPIIRCAFRTMMRMCSLKSRLADIPRHPSPKCGDGSGFVLLPRLDIADQGRHYVATSEILEIGVCRRQGPIFVRRIFREVLIYFVKVFCQTNRFSPIFRKNNIAYSTLFRTRLVKFVCLESNLLFF